jgi:biotin carboxylase
VVAHVAEAFGLRGSSPEAAGTARHKYRMREALCRHGVAHPRYARATSREELFAAADAIGYPLIYKPVAASSSKGVLRIDDPQELRPAYEVMQRYATPEADAMFSFYAGEYVVEEFMTGPEVSVEGVVFDGAVSIVGITEKLATPEGFIEYQHAFPARLPAEDVAAIEDISVAALQAVGLDNCGFHVEVMRTPEGPKIVEVNGRLGGDLITTHLIPLSTGIDIVAAALKVALGEGPDLEPRHARGACARFLLTHRDGVVVDWQGTDRVGLLPGVEAFGVERQRGQHVGLPPRHAGCARLAYVVTQGPDVASAIRRADTALKTVECQVA